MTSADDYFDDGIFERRIAGRAPYYRAGIIRFPGLLGIVSCTVREVSDRDAGIRLHSAPLLPVEFDLFDEDRQNIKRCRLVWRDGDFVGVEFMWPFG